MRLHRKRWISWALLTAFITTSATPAFALKPTETAQGAGLEELDEALRSGNLSDVADALTKQFANARATAPNPDPPPAVPLPNQVILDDIQPGEYDLLDADVRKGEPTLPPAAPSGLEEALITQAASGSGAGESFRVNHVLLFDGGRMDLAAEIEKTVPGFSAPPSQPFDIGYNHELGAGLEETGVGSLPQKHQIDYHFTAQFKSGRIPTGSDAHRLLKRQRISHAQLATQWIGVKTVAEGLVGAAIGLGPVEKKRVVDKVDILGQEVQDQVARRRGRHLWHFNFETKDLTPGGLPSGAKGGDPFGIRTPTISDVVEHTTAFVSGEPGSSSMQMEGPGAETLGSFPDGARALMVVTHIDRSREAAVLQKYGARSVEALLDPELPVEVLIHRVAELNGVAIGRVDVTILTNEESEVEALEALRETYGDLQIHRVKAGTVVPSLAAALGVKDGRVRVFLRRSGMAEAVFMTVLASLFTADGSLSIFRVVSEEVKSSFGQRYDWVQRILKDLEALRPDDWQEIRDGKKSFSSRQVTNPVNGAYTFLTNGRRDIGLPFDVPGIRQEGGLSTVHSLVFAPNTSRPGSGYLWLAADAYPTPLNARSEGASPDAQAGLEETPEALVQRAVGSAEWASDGFATFAAPDGGFTTVAPVAQEPSAFTLHLQTGLEEPKGLPESVSVVPVSDQLAAAVQGWRRQPPLAGAVVILNDEVVGATYAAWLPVTDPMPAVLRTSPAVSRQMVAGIVATLAEMARRSGKVLQIRSITFV